MKQRITRSNELIVCFVVSQAMPITPIASDKLGRRAGLFIGSMIMLCGVALQCAANTVAMFIGARFISECRFIRTLETF